jgi:hypothetical protein
MGAVPRRAVDQRIGMRTELKPALVISRKYCDFNVTPLPLAARFEGVP